jgi:hypothetical protein
MLILIAGVFQRYLALMFARRLPLCICDHESSRDRTVSPTVE